MPGKRYRNCELAAQLPSSLMPLMRITSPQRLPIAEAARRYADNDLDRLRRRKLRLHRGGCEIDAEHEQRGTEEVSRKAGNPDHTVAPCLVRGLGKNLSLGVSTDQRSGCTTILTNPPGRVCTSASASLTFASG